MKKLTALLMFMLVACTPIAAAIPTKAIIKQTTTLTTAPLVTLPGEALSGWTSFGSINYLKVIAFDHVGNLWAGGEGGIVQWRPDGSYINYTRDNGLTDNHVLSIAVAPDGAVWVGTLGGVSRFDGTEWQRYPADNSLKDTPVSSIVVAPDSTLWFGTAKGISHFDGANWTNFAIPGTDYFNTVADHIAVTRDGVLWAGTDENVWRFDGKTWTSYIIHDKPEDNYTSSLIAASDGTVWVGTLGGGISHFNGKAWKSYTKADGLTETAILFIATAPNGALWAGGAFDVSYFDGATWTNYPMVDDLSDNAYRSIALASDGTLWLATDKGVLHLNGKTQTSYTTKDGLADNQGQTIVIAPDGTLGVGTEFGVSRFDGKNWNSHTTHDGPASNAVSSIAAARDGTVWIGTDNGVSRFDGKTWTSFTTRDGLASNNVWSIAVAPDGALLFGTNNGISRFDGKNWTDYTASESTGYLDNYTVFSMAVTPDGTLWASTQTGLWHFNGTVWTRSITFPDLIAVAPDGTLWIGDHVDGVSRLSGGTSTSYTTKDGLVDNGIYSIAVAPDGTVWLGTNNGVSHFDGKNWTNYSTGDGLASTYVESIAVTPDGVAWFGTDKGASRFDGKTWTTFTTSDGLTNNDIKVIAVAPDGSLWFGTPSGVSRFDGKTRTNQTTYNGPTGNSIPTTTPIDTTNATAIVNIGPPISLMHSGTPVHPIPSETPMEGIGDPWCAFQGYCIIWFVGLGVGTNPNELAIEQAVGDDLFNDPAYVTGKLQIIAEVVPYNSAKDTILTQIAAGNGPDIVGPASWRAANILHGQWLDLRSLIAADPAAVQGIDPTLLVNLKAPEGQIGLPIAVYPSAIFYNTALFDKAGLDYPPSDLGPQLGPASYRLDGKKVVWDWDTVREVSRRLTLDANGRNATEQGFDRSRIMQYGFSWSYETQPSYIGTFWGSGSYVAPDGRTAYLPTAWKAALSWTYDGMWGTQPFIPTDPASKGLDVGNSSFDYANPFDDSKAAMTIQPSWYLCCVNHVKTWDVGVLPAYQGKVAGRVDEDFLGILKDTKNPKEAFQAMTYLLTTGRQELTIGTAAQPPAYNSTPFHPEDQPAWLEAKKT